MRRLAVALAVLLALLILVVGTSFLLIESGEGVVLRSGRDDGGEFLARLWVVDHDGLPWIGKMDPSAARWVARVRSAPRVELARGGVAECRDAVFVLDPDVRAAVYALFVEKYRIPLYGARLLGLLTGGSPDPEASAGSAVLIRLEPCDPTQPGDVRWSERPVP